MFHHAMMPGAAGDPFTVRLGEGASLIDLGGVHVDPCDVLAVDDREEGTALLLRGCSLVIWSLLTRSQVVARMEAEMQRRVELIRARMPKPPTEEEIAAMQRQQQRMVIESMTEAMKAARKAADPDGDAPWKQGE